MNIVQRAFLVASTAVVLGGSAATALVQEREEIKGTQAEPADAAEVRAQVALVEKLKDVVPDRAAVLYYRATAEQHLGETSEALRTLKECLALREGFDPSGGPAFIGWKESKEFKDLVETVHRDFPAVAQARVAFVTGEKDLVPEGLAYNEKLNVFYLSSLNRRKIVKVAADSSDSRFSDFVQVEGEHLLPVLGIRVDPTDGTVWANSFRERGETELLHYAANGELLQRFAPADGAKHGFNDLVVRRNGDVLVTDSLDGHIYKFERATQKFTALVLHRALSYPNGITLDDSERQLFVADDLGVIRVDLRQKDVSADVNPGPRSTLAGIDGLYWHKGGLVAVQNGIGSPRVAAFRLSNDGLRITQTVVLETRSPLLALPTTGAIRGNDFYFILNSQVDNMNDDKVLDSTRLERVKIGVVHLPW